MTLDQWMAKNKGYVGTHNSGARYIPGCVYLEPQAYRDLWTLSDYRVSSVIGGSIWLQER